MKYNDISIKEHKYFLSFFNSALKIFRGLKKTHCMK